MRTQIVALVLGAGSLLVAATVGAQEVEHKANTRGLFVNGHFNGTSARYSDPSTTESGGGAGFQLGYGFTRNLTLFFGTDASRISFGQKSVEDPGNFRIDFEDKYWLKQVELGARWNFVSPVRTWVPYVEAAYMRPFGGSDFTFTDLSGGGNSFDGNFTLKDGNGFTGGLGLQYFFSQKLAVDVSAKYSKVKFSKIELEADGGGSASDDTETKFDLTRVNFGLAWYPQLGR